MLAGRVRRANQARQAEESDVTGLPGFWIECQNAVKPTPIDKLRQAERDVLAASSTDIPISVTYYGAHNIVVTLRLRELMFLYTAQARGYFVRADVETSPEFAPVSMRFEEFLDLIEPHIVRACMPIRRVKR